MVLALSRCLLIDIIRSDPHAVARPNELRPCERSLLSSVSRRNALFEQLRVYSIYDAEPGGCRRLLSVDVVDLRLCIRNCPLRGCYTETQGGLVMG